MYVEEPRTPCDSLVGRFAGLGPGAATLSPHYVQRTHHVRVGRVRSVGRLLLLGQLSPVCIELQPIKVAASGRLSRYCMLLGCNLLLGHAPRMFY